MKKSRLLLLSGYHASSHRFWCDQLTNGLPEFDWTLLALPDRHFYWRIRSNALTFALEYKDTLRQKYDLIVETSMVEHLASVPAVLYFHEISSPTLNVKQWVIHRLNERTATWSMHS